MKWDSGSQTLSWAIWRNHGLNSSKRSIGFARYTFCGSLVPSAFKCAHTNQNKFDGKIMRNTFCVSLVPSASKCVAYKSEQVWWGDYEKHILGEPVPSAFKCVTHKSEQVWWGDYEKHILCEPGPISIQVCHTQIKTSLMGRLWETHCFSLVPSASKCVTHKSKQVWWEDVSVSVCFCTNAW